MNQYSPKIPLASNCHNCGIKDDLEYFEHVFNGITLCQDCASLPYSKVKKRGSEVKWVNVNGELMPPDLVRKAPDE